MDYVALHRGWWFDDSPPTEWARAREAEGWSGVAVPDHLHSGGPGDLHPFATLGAMAASTSTIQLGTAYANNLIRSPVEFAQASLTLQALSHGRFEAGLGAGWQQGEIRGIGMTFPNPTERARRLREAIEIVAGLFRGPVEHSGVHYRVDLKAAGPRVGERPRLAAALGGPWTMAHIGPLVDHIEVVTFGAAVREGQVDFAMVGQMTETDLREMIDLARRANPSATIGLSVWAAVGESEVADFLDQVTAGGVFDGVAGTASRVAETFNRLAELPIDRITVVPPLPGTIEALGPLLHG